MSALKVNNINTHVVDILGSTKGRDQPIMKMDKAVNLAECLGKEVFSKDEYVFFNPFCKAGEILLAVALTSALYRKNKTLVSVEEIAKEIHNKNKFFGLAPDQRHHMLSLRTFFGNEKCHSKEITQNFRNGKYLSEADGKLDANKFQMEVNRMIEYIKERAGHKKIIAVGNPPYQEEDSGHGRSAKPIYNILIESLIDSDRIDQFVFVIPARWFSGGKGLDNFRSKMITSGQIKTIRYFENPHHVFPTVEIRGGVCFLHWSRSFKGSTCIDDGVRAEELNLGKYDIIVPHIKSHSILEKVIKKSDRFLNQVIWARKPFGLAGNYFKNNNNYQRGLIECFCEGKKIKTISKNLISKNQDKIDKYKVAFPEASGGGKGKRDKILPRAEYFFILNKNQISTETYSVANSFDTLKEAENFLKFLQTYFARFLLGLRKPTQHTSIRTFSWVPLMDTKISWTDEMLYQYFGISKEEQKYIKEKVDKWTA